MAGTGNPLDPKAFDWCEPRPWSCPQCQAVTVTKDAAPRCAVCGYREEE